MVKTVLSTMAIPVMAADDLAALMQSKVSKHGEDTICMQATTGEVAPVAGSFTAVGQQPVVVAAGSVASESGTFCYAKQDALLIQRTFGSHSTGDLEQAALNKGDTTTTTTTVKPEEGDLFVNGSRIRVDVGSRLDSFSSRCLTWPRHETPDRRWGSVHVRTAPCNDDNAQMWKHEFGYVKNLASGKCFNTPGGINGSSLGSLLLTTCLNETSDEFLFFNNNRGQQFLFNKENNTIKRDLIARRQGSPGCLSVGQTGDVTVQTCTGSQNQRMVWAESAAGRATAEQAVVEPHMQVGSKIRINSGGCPQAPSGGRCCLAMLFGGNAPVGTSGLVVSADCNETVSFKSEKDAHTSANGDTIGVHRTRHQRFSVVVGSAGDLSGQLWTYKNSSLRFPVVVGSGRVILCLEAPAGSPTALILRQCDHLNNDQKFQFNKEQNSIQSNDGRCMVVNEASPNKQVVMSPCDGSENQKMDWEVEW